MGPTIISILQCSTNCVFHATRVRRNGLKNFQTWYMLIKQGLAIKGVVYYNSIMTTTLDLLLILLRDYLVQFSFKSTMNILLVISNSSIQIQVNQQQTKGQAWVLNIWKDITLMLPYYNDCFTVKSSFKFLFSSMMYSMSMTSHLVGKNV